LLNYADCVDNLKTLLAPILPHTAQKLHEYLGYEGQLFGTQHVVEYQEEARLVGVRSHEALTYDPNWTRVQSRKSMRGREDERGTGKQEIRGAGGSAPGSFMSDTTNGSKPGSRFDRLGQM
jgi:hypothetical protein